MKLRIGQVVVVLCMAAAVVWLAPPASAEAAISGTVTDTTAHPLEGIEVCAVIDAPFGSTGGGCTETDANGEYTLAGAGTGYLVQFYSRENSAPGYAPQWYPGKAHSDEAVGVAEADLGHVDAAMALGGTVTGTVRSKLNSAPIEGVEVCPTRAVFENHGVTFCDKTDANGEYALRGLGTDEYRFEFRTEGEVNYLETTTSPHQVQAGFEAHLDAALVPGVMAKGMVKDAGTGLPVEGLHYPYSAPLVCALAYPGEERIKCTGINADGTFAIPGLPPGQPFGLVFAADTVEEGFDTAPDGYTRQYWDEVPTWAEAAIVAGSGGSTFAGIKATLTRGPEVFPHCEVASACPPPPSGESPPPTQYTPPIGVAPVLPPLLEQRLPGNCTKGFRKVGPIGHRHCAKIPKKHPRKHHQKRKHSRR
jgi:hypothetical protein